MHLALLPGLLALVGGLLGVNTNANHPDATVFAQAHSIFSIAAQTVTTTTTTTTSTTTATTALTTTNAVTATATITQSTPIVQPTVGTGAGQGSLRFNPVDWAYLTSPPNPPIGLFGWIYIGTMLVLFGVSAYFYFFKRIEWKRTNPVLRRAAERWGPIGLWVSGLGLLFVVFRFISLDFFNLRFWFYIWLMAAIVAIAWLFYWYRSVYPEQLAKYQKTQRARQYMPTPKKGSAPVASAQSGKKRRR